MDERHERLPGYRDDEDFWGTEKGSVPLSVWCREDGWTRQD